VDQPLAARPELTAAPFILCFEAHGAPGGRVWSVRQGNRWRHAQFVNVFVPLVTVYHGPDARQPKAYLLGIGVVKRHGSRLEIRNA
jgi:hypothetical protein